MVSDEKSRLSTGLRPRALSWVHQVALSAEQQLRMQEAKRGIQSYRHG